MPMTSKDLAKKIVRDLLDHGIAASTWKDTFPEAYTQLVKYRLDMERQVQTRLEWAKLESKE